ncbi:flagellar hook-associated protein FlgL [Paenibacillus rhizovicinus]|uniref:Flagellar hook-associated protein FlgL n=1 Tax=Paenibacillus rhizovicinus TaxID=2704463 RepID=A0A6C0P7U6_9BACL|nr:flagellar hook-associated protein FlgL [Paenibacillus rhizovicinus]QHW32592.1 flagellar hook-associated protein FlgL [Paenibacillus rhizovicinus]
MALRVTPGMMHLQLSRNLNRNLTQMSSLQNEMSTGRKINKPSDDPVGITYALRYRAELSSNSQYQENADSAQSWLDYNDTVLGQAGDVLKRVKELVVNGATGTNPQTALDAINDELTQLKSQLLDIANSQLNGKYVFGGQKFDQVPYDQNQPGFDAKQVATDTGDVSYVVGSGVTLQINMSGNEVFGGGNPTESDNVFAVLDNIISKFAAGDHGGAGAELANLDSRTNKILNARSEIGARTNRVELMQNRLGDLETNLTDLQSKVEDADYDKLLIDSQVNQNIYQASLSVGAKVITPTLVDFLH